MEVPKDDFNEELLSGGCGLYPRQRGKRNGAQSVSRPVVKAEPGNDAAKQALSRLGIEHSNPATR